MLKKVEMEKISKIRDKYDLGSLPKQKVKLYYFNTYLEAHLYLDKLVEACDDIEIKELNVIKDLRNIVNIYEDRSICLEISDLKQRYLSKQEQQSLPELFDTKQHDAVASPNLLSSYHIRPCCDEDGPSIENIMKEAFDDEPKSRDAKYWVQQFNQENKGKYGYVIELYNESTVNVIGCAMYKWDKPLKGRQSDKSRWHIDDFNVQRKNNTNPVSYQWKDGFQCNNNNNKNGKVSDKYMDLQNNNKNLKKNWSKLSTYFVHLTDIAINENHRNQKLGRQLLQCMIYSFPSGTRFGLEVACDNIVAINCYRNCGVLFYFIEMYLSFFLFLMYILYAVCDTKTKKELLWTEITCIYDGFGIKLYG